MKRRYAKIGTIIALSLALAGCGSVPNMTEEQSDLIAEYAGGILLRYSNRYDLRLVTADQDGDGMEDGAPTPIPTEDPDATETPEPTATPADGQSDVPDESETPAETEEPTVSLDEIYGIQGLTFSYASSELMDKYPKDSDDMIIQAGEDETLYVVTFNVKNTTSNTVSVDLTARQIEYSLDIGGAEVAPSISLLPNGGLNYLMTDIKAEKTEKALLIFNLDKSRAQTGEKTLTITEGDKKAVVKM